MMFGFELTLILLVALTICQFLSMICSCRATTKQHDYIDELKKITTKVQSEIRRGNKILVSIKQQLSENKDGQEKQENKLYIGNLDYDISEEELEDHFAKYGTILQVNIPINKHTGRTRGFGFITFDEQGEADAALQAHETELKGRKIQVTFAKEKS